MGFALWLDREVAWAEGTHEYRPMGAGVVAITDRFRPRDFRAGRRCPMRQREAFVGLFASLEAVNDSLRRRISAGGSDQVAHPTPPWL
ncbi:MAG TPA: hypothetical protein VFL57_12880 [Bryobacteraceae bacterium]|nr:hypothetical protein [Bryobacteraceae bacterium]